MRLRSVFKIVRSEASAGVGPSNYDGEPQNDGKNVSSNGSTNEDVSAFGSSSTIAVSYGSNTECGILAGKSSRGIQCFQGGELFSIHCPNMSYEALVDGKNMICGLSSGCIDLFCWDTRFYDFITQVRQIYHNPISPLTDLTVGIDRVCALRARTSIIQ